MDTAFAWYYLGYVDERKSVSNSKVRKVPNNTLYPKPMIYHELYS